MPLSLAHIALIVRDYDEAIAWFTDKLGFTLVADEPQPEQNKRWVLVAPAGAGADADTLLLTRAATPKQAAFRPAVLLLICCASCLSLPRISKAAQQRGFS